VACWLAVISAMDKLRDWPEPRTLFPLSTRKQLDSALTSMSVRCFLHLRQGRDDNLLLWESQDEAAARAYRNTRFEGTDAADGCESISARRAPVPGVRTVAGRIPAWSSLYRQFQHCARLSNADFSVVDGSSTCTAQCPARPRNAVAHVSFHGDTACASTTTEYRIEQVLPSLAADLAAARNFGFIWATFPPRPPSSSAPCTR
jgi:hypothetical protein